MKITVLGAGAYGIALALAAYRNQNQVTIWTKLEEEQEEISKYRENKKSLPGVFIPDDIMVTTDLSCIKNSQLIIIAVSIPYVRNTCLELKDDVTSDMHFCIASKGMEQDTNQFAYQIFQSIIPSSQLSILSGPTFAIDLANGSVGGVSLASLSQDTIEVVKKGFESTSLQIVVNHDLIGTSLCGSIKNVMAIIAGMLDGTNLSETTKSFFYVQALEEIKHLVIALGGVEDTVYTLAGIGDLLLTCTSKKSRNFTLGVLLARNQKEVNSYIQNHTVEGYSTLLSIYQLLQKKNISSLLIELLYQILFQNVDKRKLLNLFDQ